GKRGYMRTILSLASPPKTLPLATSMAGSRVQMERRFTMIQNAKKPSRLASFLSVMVAIALLSTSVFASGVAANAAGIGTGEKNAIEVYNDTTKLRFTHQPFFENGEVYLPLRETLAGFGITDVRWKEGSIYVGMSPSTHYEASLPQTSDCALTIGSKVLNFPSISKGVKLKFLPLVKNGTTYVSMDFFEALIAHGQVPRFRVSLVQSRNPEDYYAEGEEVYIGIGEKQDNYKPVDESGRPKLVKRIVTNEAGEVLFVATAENQRPEVIASKPQVDTGSGNGFTRSGASRIIFTNAYGEDVDGFCGIFIYQRTGDHFFVNVAYIPPEYQIDHSVGEVPKATPPNKI
ncbi:MAG: stalk domain-containing protein, partial [Evtepia sp.]